MIKSAVQNIKTTSLPKVNLAMASLEKHSIGRGALWLFG